MASPSPSKLKKFVELSEIYSNHWVNSAGEVLLKDNPLDDKSSIDIFGDEKKLIKL